MLRYARQLALPEVGLPGQARLGAARVLVVGAGGLGSPAALYLAAAGVGTVGVVDPDRVELSNLQRQVLHATPDVGRPKAQVAAERLRALNPEIRVEPHAVALHAGNALTLLAGYDLVVDGSDNFATRYLVNDAALRLGIPWVYAAILRWEGQLALFGTPGGPCYRCLFREPPPPGAVPGCAQAGVIGALPGILGSLQALEAVKWIVGGGGADPGAQPLETAAGRLLIFDAARLRLRELQVRPDPACPACGAEARARVAADPTLPLPDYTRICGDGPGWEGGRPGAEGPAGRTPEGTGLQEGSGIPAMTAVALRDALAGPHPPLLVDVREGWEWTLGRVEGAVHLPLGAIPVDAEAAEPTTPESLATILQAREEGRDLVVVCRAGGRSLEGALRLKAMGFSRVSNLEGGLLAWTREVDSGIVVG